MNPQLNNYFNLKQYNTILKYWSIIESLKNKVEKFNNLHNNYTMYAYSDYHYEKEDIDRSYTMRFKLENYYDNLMGKLQYFEEEYKKYVFNIEYELNNQNYDETLFNLLNNGIIIE